MPSRPSFFLPSLPPSPATALHPSPHPRHHLHLHHHLILFLLLLLLLLLLLSVYFLLRRCCRSRNTTSLLPFSPPRPTLPLTVFPFRHLRSATASFEPSRLLGRGASASVFLGFLPSGKSVAIKLISPTTTTASDFHNELSVLSSLPPSPFVIPLLGYSCSRKLLLVYDFMSNGSLQEALFQEQPEEQQRCLLSWEKRYQIILDVAQGLAFLHCQCDPPVVHGDIKPSNVLLDHGFRAKIADFGLARFKTPAPPPPEEFLSQDLSGTSPPAVAAVVPDFNFSCGGPSSSSCGNLERKMRPNPIAVLDDDDNDGELVSSSPAAAATMGDEQCRKDEDWWWKQDESGEVSSRDYVRDWIGSQIHDDDREEEPVVDKLKHDHCDDSSNRKKNAKVKEWWKEEYFAEMNRKSRSSKGLHWFQKISTGNNNNVDGSSHKPKHNKKRNNSAGCEMWSGDLFSRELTSTTTSMRGTIGYVAPEHGLCGQLMEKSDIYSFGILILVIVSGRRPLHVLSSPMRLERANLVSWCRQLASSGNFLDLLDEKLKGCYDKEQADLCINLALLCLQKLPELRPDSGNIVKILKREMELPVIPFEFSPSPNSKSFSRSRRKATRATE